MAAVRAQEAGERSGQEAGETSAQETAADGLYALSAVLMDADNGRVLLQKNGTQVLPMASTTKIMTCILALELATGGVCRSIRLCGRHAEGSSGGKAGTGVPPEGSAVFSHAGIT